MRRIIFTAALAVTVQGAYAHSGSELKEMCNHQPEGERYCLFWTVGMREGLIAAAALSQSDDMDQAIGYCAFSDRVTNLQRRDVFIKYLNDNPERLHERGGALFILSMVQAFPLPCDR